MDKLFVNAYLVTQMYGGPEEGGWYYYVGEPLASVPIATQDLGGLDKLKMELKQLFADKEWGNMHHSTGGQEVWILVEEEFAEIFPKEKPHYE